jgi:hypothetical protein
MVRRAAATEGLAGHARYVGDHPADQGLHFGAERDHVVVQRRTSRQVSGPLIRQVDRQQRVRYEAEDATGGTKATATDATRTRLGSPPKYSARPPHTPKTMRSF